MLAVPTIGVTQPASSTYTAQTATCPAASVGENANNMRAAIMPTGKKRSISGGGGSGGSINGRTTSDAARTASTTTDPTLKNRTIVE